MGATKRSRAAGMAEPALSPRCEARELMALLARSSGGSGDGDGDGAGATTTAAAPPESWAALHRGSDAYAAAKAALSAVANGWCDWRVWVAKPSGYAPALS
eukprot:c6735_g1_i1.p2 GENE.c6735_g1_i1~~c6735_g1_i1.p2  ORF type:complete len:118 (-),score=17.99 c6735_g1_i1:5-307(-)